MDNPFDVQLCSRQGRRSSRGVGKSSSARSSWQHKCSSETPPHRCSGWQTGLSARGQAEFPHQQGQRGPGGTSQQPCVQLSAECDTVASASLPLISEGRAGRDSIAKCEMGRWEGEWIKGGGLGTLGAGPGNFINKAIVFQGGGTSLTRVKLSVFGRKTEDFIGFLVKNVNVLVEKSERKMLPGTDWILGFWELWSIYFEHAFEIVDSLSYLLMVEIQHSVLLFLLQYKVCFRLLWTDRNKNCFLFNKRLKHLYFKRVVLIYNNVLVNVLGICLFVIWRRRRRRKRRSLSFLKWGN